MAEDAQGFTRPSNIGFPDFGGDIDDNLKMRLFPMFEMKQAYSGNPGTASLMEHVFGISNTAHFMGANFQQMPGIIWSMCLGSPIGIPVGATFASSSNYPKVPTIGEWIQHYLIGQLFGAASHLYFNRSANNWGGVCLYLDVTEGSILSREFNVIEVLTLLVGGRPHFSSIETDDNKRAVTGGAVEAIEWLITKIHRSDPTRRASLGMIMVYAMYAIFRKFKHLQKGADWATEPQTDAARRDYHDYNLRVYLIKRRGRFLYDPMERGENKVPFGEMPAKREERGANGTVTRADELNLSQRFWLAMSQYYRLMSCWMVKKDVSFTIGGTQYTYRLKTLRRFITRDAHACTPSSISGAYDAVFFNEAASSGHERAIMLGTDGWYKKQHHAKFYTQEATWARGKPPGLFDSFGILAGVCWYFNPNMEEQFCNYPIFRLPFDILRTVNRNGVDSRIPTLLHEKDVDNFIDSNAFFNYGVDEYILSEFVAQHYNTPERWGEINLLFFTIHWMYFHLMNLRSGIRDYEYHPVLVDVLQNALSQAPWNYSPDRYYTEFLREGFQQYKNTYFDMFYGNEGNIGWQHFTIRNVNVVAANQATELRDCLVDLRRVFPKLIITDVWGQLGYNRDCIMRYVHRYDRPFYWKYTDGSHILSPRLIDGAYSVPNNIYDDAANLRLVLRNPIDRACGVGLCTTDIATDPQSGTCGVAAGGRRKKKYKTQKQKKIMRSSKKSSKTRKH